MTKLYYENVLKIFEKCKYRGILQLGAGAMVYIQGKITIKEKILNV